MNNAVRAFGKLGMKDEAQLKAVSRRAQETLREFNSQELANAEWEFGKLGLKDEVRQKVVSRRAQETSCEFDSQELATTVWAFGKLGLKDEAELELVSGGDADELCAKRAAAPLARPCTQYTMPSKANGPTVTARLLASPGHSSAIVPPGNLQLRVVVHGVGYYTVYL